MAHEWGHYAGISYYFQRVPANTTSTPRGPPPGQIAFARSAARGMAPLADLSASSLNAEFAARAGQLDQNSGHFPSTIVPDSAAPHSAHPGLQLANTPFSRSETAHCRLGADSFFCPNKVHTMTIFEFFWCIFHQIVHTSPLRIALTDPRNRSRQHFLCSNKICSPAKMEPLRGGKHYRFHRHSTKKQSPRRTEQAPCTSPHQHQQVRKSQNNIAIWQQIC